MRLNAIRNRSLPASVLFAVLMTAGPASNALAEESKGGEVQEKTDEAPNAKEKAKSLKDFVKFETLWYLHYRYGHGPVDSKDLSAGYDDYNKFDIGRGYLTLKAKPLSWFQGRITLDAHQDSEGDMKVRLKYLYGKFTAPIETKVLTEPFAEVGLVHMPWLDYEEHINWYRSQGTMFMERNKLFNSADFGLTTGVLLGPKLKGRYVEEVSDKYPGSWGSMAVGVYNGGGYHALEANANKSFEGRLSVRPAGPFFPNVQLSYFTVVGKGNVESTDEWDPPEWRSQTFMGSFEHRYLAATGQFVIGQGNQKGDFVDWTTEVDSTTGDEFNTGIDNVHEYMGASGFLELKLPWIRSSLIGRYDWFDKEDTQTQRWIGGYAFHFYKMHKNFLMVDVDYVIPDESLENAKNFWELKLTLQIKL